MKASVFSRYALLKNPLQFRLAALLHFDSFFTVSFFVSFLLVATVA